MEKSKIAYDKLIIYYFSGTGNAKNAAQWICDIATEKGIGHQLINIDRFQLIEKPEISGKALIGFCTPTHGFNIPPIMLKFIRKFPKLKQTDVFILNTRGGLKLSKLFIPGLSGAAQILPAAILRAKGFKIVGMQPLDLPSNWLFLHPGLKPKVVQSIYSRCEKIVKTFASDLLSGKKKFKAMLSLPFDILILPVALGYFFIGRFFLAKTLVATNTCDNCGICIKGCPVEAIKMVDNSPFWSYKCENCMRCVNICPQRAIETTHGFSISLLLLSSFIITPLFIAGLKFLGVWDFINHSLFTEQIWSFTNTFLFILIVFAIYRMLHFFMRFKVFNNFVKYTSLSSYKFWRRYQSPKSN